MVEEASKASPGPARIEPARRDGHPAGQRGRYRDRMVAPLTMAERDLLAVLVDADDAAIRAGDPDERFFATNSLSGPLVVHAGLPGGRQFVSGRALAGLRAAGLFMDYRSHRIQVSFYLAEHARRRLSEAQALPPARPPSGLTRRPTGRRRARALPDPAGAFRVALIEALNAGEGRLSKEAIATRMAIDPGTLRRYIYDGLVPPPPWEALARQWAGDVRDSLMRV